MLRLTFATICLFFLSLHRSSCQPSPSPSPLPTDQQRREISTDFWPQAISMIASFTAGLSTIIAVQLSKRFPISYHASSPRWKYTVWPAIFYICIYIALVIYGIFRRGVDYQRISATLAFMSAPGVPLHGFLWALLPQTQQAVGPPATETYLRQCFTRKPSALLVLTWLPLVGAAIASGIARNWQGLALQLAAAIAFLATARTPEIMPRAQESSFGRAGRYLLLPRPGRRNDTVGYVVDLQEETMLPPVRLSMEGVEAYKRVSELTFGRAGRDSDDENTSETPVVSYLDELVALFRPPRLSGMAVSLWRTLEEWKGRVDQPAKELPLMYALVERMGYVAFRPGTCTLDERRILITLNFINCRADVERGDPELREIAYTIMMEWRDEGKRLMEGASWQTAFEAGGNTVDRDVPAASEILTDESWSDTPQKNAVETVGAVVSCFRLCFGHNADLVESIIRNVPHYHQRIRSDLMEHGCIPAVCHGILFSMKKKGMLAGNVHGHEWAAAGERLLWGGGGYAILDQAYARNSAIAYVGQLAIIVVKAVLEN